MSGSPNRPIKISCWSRRRPKAPLSSRRDSKKIWSVPSSGRRSGATFGGVALSGLGVGLALSNGWRPEFIVGLLGIGIILGFCARKSVFSFFIGRR